VKEAQQRREEQFVQRDREGRDGESRACSASHLLDVGTAHSCVFSFDGLSSSSYDDRFEAVCAK
jgi:hypothetical protein